MSISGTLTSYLPGPKCSSVVSDIYWLSLTQVASYICPLLNIVFLGRALGPNAWGTLATFQGLSNWFCLIIEYGFSTSAVREVAENRDRPRMLEDILASVLWAKLALASGLTLLIACSFRSVPILRHEPGLVLCALIVAAGPSLTPAWFYQGLERIRSAALIDFAGRIIGTVLTISLVHHPSQVWIALVIPGLASFTAVFVNYARLYRHYSFVAPSFRLVRHALTFGWSMFLNRSSVILYTSGNAFILALFAAPEYVGYYAAAERIARYSTALLTPLSQALLPRMTYLVTTDFPGAMQLAAKSFRFMIIFGVALGAVTFLGAPNIIHLCLGSRFDSAIPVLRILSLLPPSIAISNFIGFQCLVPLRKDSILNSAILAGGVMNIALAVTLAPHYRQYGAAWAVVIAEILVSLTLVFYLRRHRLFPPEVLLAPVRPKL